MPPWITMLVGAAPPVMTELGAAVPVLELEAVPVADLERVVRVVAAEDCAGLVAAEVTVTAVEGCAGLVAAEVTTEYRVGLVAAEVTIDAVEGSAGLVAAEVISVAWSGTTRVRRAAASWERMLAGSGFVFFSKGLVRLVLAWNGSDVRRLKQTSEVYFP